MPGQPWIRDFNVREGDIDYLTNLLLEREKPLSTQELALALIDAWLEEEEAALQERYKDTRVYNPAHSYEVGQRLMFPVFDNATGVVTDIRPGDNPDYGDFNVIKVEFDEEERTSEFAADLHIEHRLSSEESNGHNPLTAASNIDPEALLESRKDDILPTLENYLEESDSLVCITDKWFPRDLMIEVDVGTLHLAEAVLDIVSGGPLPPEEILEQIGKLDDSPLELQVFSLNYALNEDDRFDEVGPWGEVLWFLQRMEPAEVQSPPALLHYQPAEYDRSRLTKEMLKLEAEIGDEWSPLEADPPVEEATITLIYPHRRLGTLPLNRFTRHIFPTAHTPRVWVTLVDGQDGEEFTGWVVHQERYVFGLDRFYRKHRLPVGAYITVRRGEESDKFVIDFDSYRPRTEWIRLITPQKDKLHFENDKRAIGAEYDDLMILGADEPEALDAMYEQTQQQSKGLSVILKSLIPELGDLTPQGTAHVKTIYSAVNVLYRYPPGPILATLIANPDFEDVGGHYWKLS